MSSQTVPGPIASRLIDHALGLDLDSLEPSARQRATWFTEDSLLVGLGAVGLPERAALLAGLDAAGPRAVGARVIGTRRRLDPATAALINGFQIHSQEFDCVHEAAVVHPMAVIAAVLLAWADLTASPSREIGQPVSGSAWIEAVVVAVDSATVLGMMASRPMRFFRPAQCGALGAALGLARLAGLNRQQTAVMLGLTLCQLSGSMQAHVEGTAGLALQVGFNARNVITALELVKHGLAGPVDALDGPFGYLSLFEEQFDPAPISEIGRVFQIERVSHKPWPTGRAAQGALDALETLLAEGLDPAAVESLTLFAPPLVKRLVDRPFRSDAPSQYARLCLPWLLSVCLARGSVRLEDFSPTALRDPARAAWTGRVQVKASDTVDPNALLPQKLVVGLRDGSRIERPINAVLGSPERPLSFDRRRAKALACARHAGLEEFRTQRLLDRLANLAALDDVSILLNDMEL
ncbi:MAG: MmgE/PrpD family protein [Wenzhouxiangella sp.]|nr:MAG: MmgE/PrpD family protein [Wenzhouxiangella sp.]